MKTTATLHSHASFEPCDERCHLYNAGNPRVRYTHTATEHRLEFVVEDAPVAPLPYSNLKYIGTHATVTVTVRGGEPPTVDIVKLDGWRAKKDGTAGGQSVGARYSVSRDELPDYVRELAEAALAIVARENDGAQ